MPSALRAIVLAAGAGRRMGRPKALAPWRETTFLEEALAALAGAGFAEPIVILDPGAEIFEEAGRRARAMGAGVVENPYATDGMLSSVRRGLDALPAGTSHAVLFPVDHPGIRPETLRALAVEATAHPEAIVVPIHRKRRGHPGLFPASLFDALRRAPDGEGARWVLRQNPDRVRTVPVEDAATVRDLDTPGDLERAESAAAPEKS